MTVKASYLIAAGGGALLLWSGVKGYAWSTTFRNLISSGKPSTTAELTAYPIQTSQAAFSGSGTGGITTPNLGVGGTVAKNKSIGRALAAAYGWGTGAQWAALDALWTQESGWNNHARNPSSGAYGIPQALPASKMGALANPPTSSASAQIAWGLKYIKTRWQTPSNAWGGYAARGSWY